MTLWVAFRPEAENEIAHAHGWSKRDGLCNSQAVDGREKELALMDDLAPLLKKRATDRAISGLNAYEQ